MISIFPLLFISASPPDLPQPEQEATGGFVVVVLPPFF